jgi:hypothetical protein
MAPEFPKLLFSKQTFPRLLGGSQNREEENKAETSREEVLHEHFEEIEIASILMID